MYKIKIDKFSERTKSNIRSFGKNRTLRAVLSFDDSVFILLSVILLNSSISRIELSILILQCVLMDTSDVHAVGFVLQIA